MSRSQIKQRLQKPMMLAYIIFLFICLSYYLICRILSWEFAAWNKIVVAATVASYFFSLSSADKFMIKLVQTNTSDIEEETVLLKKILKKEKEIDDDFENKQQLISGIEEAIKINEKALEDSKKEVNKSRHMAFWKDVLGFLTFFCVISFESIFNFFFIAQEIYTLSAFLMMMCVEYFESTKLAYFEELSQVVNNRIQKHLEYLEDVNNG